MSARGPSACCESRKLHACMHVRERDVRCHVCRVDHICQPRHPQVPRRALLHASRASCLMCLNMITRMTTYVLTRVYIIQLPVMSSGPLICNSRLSSHRSSHLCLCHAWQLCSTNPCHHVAALRCLNCPFHCCARLLCAVGSRSPHLCLAHPAHPCVAS